MRLLLATCLLATAAAAQGLDRDTLLTDAPAVPSQGTVRVTGGVIGTTDSTGVGATQGQAGYRFNDFVRAGVDSRAITAPVGVLSASIDF